MTFESNDPTPHVPRHGRRKGSGYQRVDEPLLKEMHRMLEERKAPTVEAAAKMIAHRAYGGGTKESKVDRLARRYRQQYFSVKLGS